MAWGILAALLTLALRERGVVASGHKRSWQPIITLAIFSGVFLATHAVHRFSPSQ